VVAAMERKAANEEVKSKKLQEQLEAEDPSNSKKEDEERKKAEAAAKKARKRPSSRRRRELAKKPIAPLKGAKVAAKKTAAEENPGLRLSQLKMEKSPENPMNQDAVAYNATQAEILEQVSAKRDEALEKMRVK
ncbi:hypothetical protein BC829DRAFT_381652, partial [Chytridium lagenaria]